MPVCAQTAPMMPATKKPKLQKACARFMMRWPLLVLDAIGFEVNNDFERTDAQARRQQAQNSATVPLASEATAYSNGSTADSASRRGGGLCVRSPPAKAQRHQRSAGRADQSNAESAFG